MFRPRPPIGHIGPADHSGARAGTGAVGKSTSGRAGQAGSAGYRPVQGARLPAGCQRRCPWRSSAGLAAVTTGRMWAGHGQAAAMSLYSFSVLLASFVQPTCVLSSPPRAQLRSARDTFAGSLRGAGHLGAGQWPGPSRPARPGRTYCRPLRCLPVRRCDQLARCDRWAAEAEHRGPLLVSVRSCGTGDAYPLPWTFQTPSSCCRGQMISSAKDRGTPRGWWLPLIRPASGDSPAGTATVARAHPPCRGHECAGAHLLCGGGWAARCGRAIGWASGHVRHGRSGHVHSGSGRGRPRMRCPASPRRSRPASG